MPTAVTSLADASAPRTVALARRISACGSHQQLRRALELVAEMKGRGIPCNVHTYSALMNVAIKSSEVELAQASSAGLNACVLLCLCLWHRSAGALGLAVGNGILLAHMYCSAPGWWQCIFVCLIVWLQAFEASAMRRFAAVLRQIFHRVNPASLSVRRRTSSSRWSPRAAAPTW